MGSADEKRSRKHRLNEETTQDDTPADVDVPKKKKRRPNESSLATESIPSNEVPKETKKKHKRRKEVAGSTTSAPSNETAQDNAILETHDESTLNYAKDKKRKDKPDKKNVSKKKISKYLDPAADETLDDQAQKGLVYAYAYACKKDWKFNKARQNWLMKHVYDPAFVPDIYLDTVMEYLKSVKGHALKHMHDACTSLTITTSDASTEASLKEIQISRAATLLKILPCLPVESVE